MRILKSDTYINEKLNIKPVTRTRLNTYSSYVTATDETIKEIVEESVAKYGVDANLNFINTYKVTNMSELGTFPTGTFPMSLICLICLENPNSTETYQNGMSVRL